MLGTSVGTGLLRLHSRVQTPLARLRGSALAHCAQAACGQQGSTGFDRQQLRLASLPPAARPSLAPSLGLSPSKPPPLGASSSSAVNAGGQLPACGGSKRELWDVRSQARTSAAADDRVLRRRLSLGAGAGRQLGDPTVCKRGAGESQWKRTRTEAHPMCEATARKTARSCASLPARLEHLAAEQQRRPCRLQTHL